MEYITLRDRTITKFAYLYNVKGVPCPYHASEKKIKRELYTFYTENQPTEIARDNIQESRKFKLLEKTIHGSQML